MVLDGDVWGCIEVYGCVWWCIVELIYNNEIYKVCLNKHIFRYMAIIIYKVPTDFFSFSFLIFLYRNFIFVLKFIFLYCDTHCCTVVIFFFPFFF